MSENASSYSISGPETALNDAQNFQVLRKLGLEAIIESGSNAWTDYNTHDPGITILEILSYALSDLGYRTSFPIEDILASQDFSTDELAKSQFYQAREILTTNPVSLLDFRKQLTDLEGVANAWISLGEDPLEPSNGILHITIDPEEDRLDEAAEKRLEARIRDAFYQYRNLGEDIGILTIRKPLELAFNLELEIADNIQEEEIIGQVLLLLENTLSRAARFSTFEESISNHRGRVDKVFEGPALSHGFLEDASLLPFLTELSVTDLIPTLLKLEGIISIRQLQFRPLAPLPELDPEWRFTDSFSPRNRLILAPISRHHIVLKNHKTTLTWSPRQVALEQKRLTIQERNPKLSPAKRNISIPLGQSRHLQRYLSIQADFPRMYGLPPHGLPPGSTKGRVAQKKQFQAYLMIFDQILANYLAQLAHLGQLFSWSADVKSTYFFQGLEGTIAEIKELLFLPDTTEKPQNSRQKQASDPLIEAYYQKLGGIREKGKTFLRRRNQFLSHLLARFGRSLDIYISSFEEGKKEAPTQEGMWEYQLAIKQRLLENYITLSSERAKGPVLRTAEAPLPYTHSGLRRWVETLMGMEEESLEVFRFNDRFRLDTFHIKDEEEDQDQNPVSEYQVFREDGEKVDMKELIRIGIRKENYRIVYNESPLLNGPLSHYNISIYQEPAYELAASNYYRVTPAFKTPEEALQEMEKLLDLVRQYDRSSERIFLLEHLLLRPQPHEPVLGFSLLNETGEAWLSSQNWYRRDQLESLQQSVSKGYVYYNFKGNSAQTANTPAAAKKPKVSPFQFFISASTKEPADEATAQMVYEQQDDKIVLKSGITSWASEEEAQQTIQEWIQAIAPIGLTLAENQGQYSLVLTFYVEGTLQQYTSQRSLTTRAEWEEQLIHWQQKKSVIQWAIQEEKKTDSSTYSLHLTYICPNLEVSFVHTPSGPHATSYTDLQTIRQVQTHHEQVLNGLRNHKRVFSRYWKAYYRPWPWKEDSQAQSLYETYPQYQAIFEDPFSFMVTAVMPDWPSRFQEKGFREALIKTLSQESPAHLWINVLWLDKPAFQHYQFLYGNWWRAYLQKEEGQALYAKLLMEFVMERTFPQAE